MSTNDVPNNGDQPTPEGDEGDVQPISEEGIEDEALLAKIRKQNSELKNMRQRMREGFGPERERLTQRIKELEPLASKAKEIEEAQKTEEQRMADRLSEAERKAQEATAAALRLEVALDVAPEGMSLSQIRKLAKRLTGDDREALAADAEELFADFAPPEGESTRTPPRRPQESLRSGAAPAEQSGASSPLEQTLRDKLGIQ